MKYIIFYVNKNDIMAFMWVLDCFCFSCKNADTRFSFNGDKMCFISFK